MNYNQYNIYCDMDGVLANFNAEPNAVERFKTEKNFFKKLKVLRKNTAYIRKLLKQNNKNIYILSASPNELADNDKKQWLKKHLPQLKENNIIIIRNGEKKIDYIKTSCGVLLDDYSKNLKEWCANTNNIGLKIKCDGDIKTQLELLEYMSY